MCGGHPPEGSHPPHDAYGADEPLSICPFPRKGVIAN